MTLTSSPANLASAEASDRSRPVLVWASIGAACLAFSLYLFAAWWLSGEAKPVSTGPTPVPTSAKVFIHVYEAVFVVLVVGLIYGLVIRPWRRDGTLTFDGMLLLSFFSLLWQDAFVNFSQVTFLYNAEFINFGSWYEWVPGWVSPNGNSVPEPILGILITYGPFYFLAAAIGGWCMRKAKARWPSLRPVALVLIAAGIFAVGLPVFEVLCMRFGHTWAYPGAARSGVLGALTLFPGTHYQFPLYVESVFGGLGFALMSGIRYFRNDKGRSWAERGVDELTLSPRKQNGLRFLALCGMVNVFWLFAMALPWNVFGLNSESWPNDIVSRSYLVGGNRCGPGTTYACPGPGVPIPRPSSAHPSPEGELVVPSAR